MIYFRLSLVTFLLLSLSYLHPCLAEDLMRQSVLANNVDYTIFSDSERRFLSKQIPLYRTSTSSLVGVLPKNELELTLREIELRKFEGETEEEFIDRGSSLHSELIEHPELFQQKTRSVSVSRSRFRSGLLTPLTINQLDSELASEVINLEASQLTKPIKIGNSIFILRRESARILTKPDQ